MHYANYDDPGFQPRIQNAVASFGLNKFVPETVILQQVKWLSVKEKSAEYQFIRLAHRSLWDHTFLKYLKVKRRSHSQFNALWYRV